MRSWVPTSALEKEKIHKAEESKGSGLTMWPKERRGKGKNLDPWRATAESGSVKRGSQREGVRSQFSSFPMAVRYLTVGEFLLLEGLPAWLTFLSSFLPARLSVMTRLSDSSWAAI